MRRTRHAAKSSNSREQKMNVINQNGEMHYAPDSFAAALLADCKPDWIPVELFFEMTDSLIGFTPEMALVIADDLIDCWCGLGMHVTGINHIDEQLGRLYMRIFSCAYRNGIKLAFSK